MNIEENRITTNAALREGERVLIEAVVRNRCHSSGFVAIGIASESGLTEMQVAIPVKTIFAVIPREIKKGDEVEIRGSGKRYKALHIEEGFAFLRCPIILSDTIAPIYRLAPIDELEFVS